MSALTPWIPSEWMAGSTSRLALAVRFGLGWAATIAGVAGLRPAETLRSE
jgi:hypothetical protein